VKPPPALPAAGLRRMAPDSTRPVLLISMGVMSHCDTTASRIVVKKGLMLNQRGGPPWLRLSFP
jgi:hypothetical protein